MTALMVTFTIIIITQVLPCFEHCDAGKQSCLGKDSGQCRQCTVRMANVICCCRFVLFSCWYHHEGSPDVPRIAEPSVQGNSIPSGQAAAHAHCARSALRDCGFGPAGHAGAAACLLTMIHGSHHVLKSLCNDRKWTLTR